MFTITFAPAGGPSLGNTAGQNTASRTHQLLGSLHNKVRQDAERHAVGIIPGAFCWMQLF